MGIAQAPKKRRTTGSTKKVPAAPQKVECKTKKVPAGLPIVECKRMNTHLPAFEWNLSDLTGRSLEEKRDALVIKLLEKNGDSREKAAVELLDSPGETSVKIASLMAIKEIQLKMNIGMIAQKVFNGRTFEECVDILDKAGIVLDIETTEKIRKYCKVKTMDNTLYQVYV